MHVLVTGGAGYIGSITAQALLEAGHRVTVLDDLSRGHRDLVPDCAFVEGDVGDGALVARLCDGVDACMHFAGFIDAAESVAEPEMYLETNARKTELLLDVLVEAGVERFVLSSSAAVYGTPEKIPIPIDHPRRPVNPYGRSKAEAEDAAVARSKHLRYAFLRYFNASGAVADRGEDHPTESHLIPLALDAALGRRERFTIFGTDYETRDGSCIRDYIHVADLADAHVKALEALDDQKEIVCNVGTGAGYTVKEVVETCRAVTGQDFPVVFGDRRPGDVAELVADPSDAQTNLGWEAQTPAIQDIVASAWEWHRARAGV